MSTRTLLLMLVLGLPAAAQQAGEDLRQDCNAVAVSSNEPSVADEVRRALSSLPEVRNGDLGLAYAPESADVTVFIASMSLLPQPLYKFSFRAPDGRQPLTRERLGSRGRPAQMAREILAALGEFCAGVAPPPVFAFSTEASLPPMPAATSRRDPPLRRVLWREEATARLRTIQRIRPVVLSSQMEAGDLRQALLATRGVTLAGITVVSGASDAVLEVTHPDPGSLIWKYALLDARTDEILFSGRVVALRGARAGPLIAERVGEALAPAASRRRRLDDVREALQKLQRAPEWEVRLASMAYYGAAGGEALLLAVEGEQLVLYSRETGRRLSSVPVDAIADAAFDREWRAPLRDGVLAPLDGADIQQSFNEMDPRIAPLAAVALGSWVGAGHLLGLYRRPEQFLTIAWADAVDESRVETVTLAVPRREAASLRLALAPLTAARIP